MKNRNNIFRRMSIGQLKLTFIIAVVCVVAIVAILCGNIVKGQGRTNINSDKMLYTNITVVKGDTLWDIANRYMNEDHYNSVSAYMNELSRINHLTSEDINAGDILMVVYYEQTEAE